MNLLEFELVVSVVVFAVVLDLVSTPDAHVLVPVLVHLVSLVVLVLDEIAVVVDPFVIAVSMVATRTVVAHVVFAAETLSVAAVVSDPAVWVHHVWSAYRDRLLRFSSASLAFLALQVMPYAAVTLHPSAHQTLSEILPFVAKIPVVVFHLSHLLTMRFRIAMFISDAASTMFSTLNFVFK